MGVGAGQMSRVYSSRIGAIKAEDDGLSVRGRAMASDAFFPVPRWRRCRCRAGRDGRDPARWHRRDDEVIAAANEHGMAMVFTGMRHFRH